MIATHSTVTASHGTGAAPKSTRSTTQHTACTSLRYVTSFTQLKSQGDSKLGRIINSAPHALQPATFALVQLVYTGVTLLPTLVFFRYK
jgi:hypothetical protein